MSVLSAMRQDAEWPWGGHCLGMEDMGPCCCGEEGLLQHSGDRDVECLWVPLSPVLLPWWGVTSCHPQPTLGRGESARPRHVFLGWKAKFSCFTSSACDLYYGCVCCLQLWSLGWPGGCVGDIPFAISSRMAAAWVAFHASHGSLQHLWWCQIPHLALSTASAAAASQAAPASCHKRALSELLSLPAVCSPPTLSSLVCPLELPLQENFCRKFPSLGDVEKVKKVFLAVASVGKGLWL